MINEFYYVVQLLATLTIGFVILDYSDYFTKILKIKFFHANETILIAKEECNSFIPDKTTLNNLEPTTLGKGNTSVQIEELKRDCEIIEKKINDFEKNSNTKMEEMSDMHSLASLCLFVFLFSVFVLFVPVLKVLYGKFINLFLLPFSILCIIYMIIGWICGEKDNNKKIFRYESLKHPLIFFIVICVISVIFAFFSLYFSTEFCPVWKYLFVSMILCGWINFIIYAHHVKHSISKFKEYVKEEKNKIKKECQNINKKYNDIITVSKMAKSYDTE